MTGEIQIPAADISGWSHIVEETFENLQVTAQDNNTFKAGLRKIDTGKVKLYECFSHASEVYHEAACANSDETFLLKMQIEGVSQISTAQKSIQLKPGDYVICENRQPYWLAFDEPILLASIPLSMHDFRSQNLAPSRLSFVKPSTTNPIRPIVFDYLRSLRNADIDQLSLSARDSLAHVLLELTVLSIDQETQKQVTSAPTRSNMLLFKRATELIAQQYHDETLTGARLAKRLGVSLRNLQIAFSASGFTISNYILKHRLNVARRLLLASSTNKLQVSEVAFAVGFRSHSSFSRAYKAEFSQTPNESKLLNY